MLFVKKIEKNRLQQGATTVEAQVDGTAFLRIFGPVLASRKHVHCKLLEIWYLASGHQL
jgi:hypothetical protein